MPNVLNFTPLYIYICIHAINEQRLLGRQNHIHISAIELWCSYILELIHFDILEFTRLSQLIPWSTVLLEKLTVAQLVKNFPVCYGTRRFIIVFQSPPTGPLTSVTPIQSTCSNPIPYLLRTVLIMCPIYTKGSSVLFLLGSPTEMLHELSPNRATYPVHLIFNHFITPKGLTFGRDHEA
jgi:hypothetical protein